MSDLKIKVVAVEVGSAKSKAGKDYEFVEVTYKNLSFDGKVESKKHNQYGDKTVFATLKDAQPGAEFTIERKKDDAGYWQWIGITSGSGASSSSSSSGTSSVSKGATPAPKSTYETADERQARQRLIVRQSSITSAISILKTEKNTPSKKEVFDLAEDICSWVFEVQKKEELNSLVSSVDDLDSDIPV